MYINNNIAAMKKNLSTRPFNIKKSLEKSRTKKAPESLWNLTTGKKNYKWSNRLERVKVIRAGIPYEAIEVLSKKMNRPVKQILEILGQAQTTYNKKKTQEALLDSKDSEIVLRIVELVDYGIEVFDGESDKFFKWLDHPNISLGNEAPVHLLDTVSGITEVTHCLHRIEHGIFA